MVTPAACLSRSVTVAVALVVLARAAPAAADEATPAQMRTGFEPKLYAGGGGVFESAKLTVGQRTPSFGLHALLSYRIAMPLDLGLHVFHQWQDVVGLPAGANGAYSSAAGGGVVARVHPV